MNVDLLERVVHAVLYEGYILYPYRASAVKNRQRFNFGALYPEAYGIAQGGNDASRMQTQCVLAAGPGAELDVIVRFLHLVERQIVESISPTESAGRNVSRLEVDGQLFQSWQEAVEQSFTIRNLVPEEVLIRPRREQAVFSARLETEPIVRQTGEIAGRVERTRQSIEASIEVSAERPRDGLYRISVVVRNLSAGRESDSREDALMRSLLSTHTILSLRGGEFVSMLEPQSEYRDLVDGCRNEGTWPVLVGEEGSRDCMLSSPIILYDYPRVSSESAGDLFDGTEIDEILTLRILTLTDEEKREMRAADARARQILERSESLTPEQMMKLHGAVRTPEAPKTD